MRNFLRTIRKIIWGTIDWFYIKPFQVIPIETFRYAATGGANTVFDIALYFVFYNFVFEKQNVDLGFISFTPHIAAFLFVFPITFASGFVLAKYITFTESTLRGRIQLIRYIATVSGSILLNYFLLKLFVEGFGWWATFSKIVTTFVVVIYSYIAQKYFTFRKKILPSEGI
jgi:putative flippase GtrA